MKDLISNQLVKYLKPITSSTSSVCAATPTSPCSQRSRRARDQVHQYAHEQIAAHAANGYAQATNKTSVVLSHLSPGRHRGTGVANATLDSIPMVIIAGDVPSHYYGEHPHQEVNLHADASQGADLSAVRQRA